MSSFVQINRRPRLVLLAFVAGATLAFDVRLRRAVEGERAPPDAQLAALKEVSEEIQSYHAKHRGDFDARLEHFLSGCSFDKALRYLESEGEWRGH